MCVQDFDVGSSGWYPDKHQREPGINGLFNDRLVENLVQNTFRNGYYEWPWISILIYTYQHGRESINKHCWVNQNISWINVSRIIQRLKFLWMIMARFWLGTHSLSTWHCTRIYQGLIWLIISLLLVLIIIISISKILFLLVWQYVWLTGPKAVLLVLWDSSIYLTGKIRRRQ